MFMKEKREREQKQFLFLLCVGISHYFSWRCCCVKDGFTTIGFCVNCLSFVVHSHSDKVNAFKVASMS